MHALHPNTIHLLDSDSPPTHRSPQLNSQSDHTDAIDPSAFELQLPDPENEQLPEPEFWQQIDKAWQVCDRVDLQTEIWRGRILRSIRDREKRGGDGRGTGFLSWLQEREISKSQAYSLIELANSADTLLQNEVLQLEEVNRFSKRAFIETAQAAPEVQQMVCDLIHDDHHTTYPNRQITRREVRQLNDEWTAMASDLLPTEIKEKAANSTIPTRYLTPLVREMEKLPQAHQAAIQTEIAASPDVDTVKQATAEARYLAKYLTAATQVQTLNQSGIELESALEEALRIGCLSSTADLVNQASQLEQTVIKLYTTWKRLNQLSERVYLDSGASTPNLRALLNSLDSLSNNLLEVNMGDINSNFSRPVRLQILAEEMDEPIDA